MSRLPHTADELSAQIFPETEMGRLCRAVNWEQTSLGAVEQWPITLKGAVALVLRQGMPQCLCWGPELLQLYNDAYRDIMGDKHPDGFVRPVRENWAESMATIGPLLARVLTGETVFFEDLLVPVRGGGVVADAYFTFSYSPVLDDTGAIGGLLINCSETTPAVVGLRAQRERDRLTAELLVEKARLEATFEQSPSFFAILRGPENVFEAANAAYFQIVGLKRDILGKPLFEALPETRGQGFDTVLAQVRETGKPLVFRDLPVRLERTRGAFEDRFVDITYLPLLEADGTHSAVIAHGVDVTEQVRARQQVEHLLQESETARAEAAAANQQLQENAVELEAQTEELQATAAQLEERTDEADAARVKVVGILESMADAYFALDSDFRIVDVNRAMVRGSGFSRAAMLDHDFWTRFPGTLGTEFERAYRRAMAERVDGHFTHDYSDGRLDLVVDVDVYPAEGGGIAVFWRDVTQRERAARALRASEAELRFFADAVPTLAWIARADGYIEWYNARWYEYTGTSPAEMAGWGWQSVHDPAVLPSVLAGWQSSIATGTAFEMTFPLRGADGKFRQFLTRVVPQHDGAGQLIRWFGTNTDIEVERTARIAAESAATRTAQLQSLTAELAGASSLEDVARIVVSAGQRAFGASTSALIMADREKDEAVIERGIGLNAVMDRQYARFPLSLDIPATESMRSGAPVVVGNQEDLLRRYPDARDFWISQGTEAIASVPLIAGGVVIGAMSFTFARARGMALEELEFLVLLARQAAQAVERARLFAAERAENARAEKARAELSDANRQLQDQQRDMELANQLLQENAVELEAQKEELEGTAAQLEERSEEAEAARRTLSRIVEAVTDGFVAFDSALRFTYVNARAAEMWEHPLGELLGKTPFEVWPAMQQSVFVATLQRVLESGHAETVEGFATTLRKPIELRAYPTSGGGIVAFFTDLSERRRAEEAASFLAEASRVLASSADYQTVLSDLAKLAVPTLGDWCAVDVLENPDGTAWPPEIERVAVVHQDAEKLVLASTLTARFPQDWSAQTGLPSVIRTRQPSFFPEVTDAMVKAGAQNDEHYALLFALQIRSVIVVPLVARDRVLGTVTLVMAESGRRFTESDLILATDLGRRAGVALDNARLLRDASEANAVKTEFLRTISHELRQPLNAMRGYLGLWTDGLRGELPPGMLDDIARLSRNQEHLTTLIEDLLSFTRLDAGELRIERVPVPVDPIFTALEAMMRPMMDSRGIRFASVPCPPMVTVLGDHDRIIQVCLNLVTNAMRATDASGEVTMRCLAADGYATIEVIDTGHGIPEDKLESIFAPFVQVGRALNAPKEGAGLGLAISRGLAEAMGGTLTVHSVVGKGSTFALRLPMGQTGTTPP